MNKEWTFSHKVAAGFAAVVALSVAVAVLSTYALRAVVAKKDRVIAVDAANLTDAERLHAHSAMKGSIARAYLLTRDDRYLRIVQDIRGQFKVVLGGLRSRAETAEDRRAVDEIEAAEEAHEAALQPVLALRTANVPIDTINARYDREALSRREHLDRVIDGFAQREQRRLAEQQQAATDMASSATHGVIGLTALAAVLAAAVAFLLSRALTRQISSAVHHVQSSSTELQAVAGQQATGAKEQASAMSEITTTISELLATSRQIAESAQRVADIANQTAASARSGDESVIRSQDSLGAIGRQVELIVGHMLELGKKSQQVGVILDIINELSEQTNILAINATIEAAGAGESGKRFAVVADEIRKLADRVGASTKDIRALLDEVRSAVNTTVMATESGSKAVEAGARQFSELAAAFKQIVSLVGTTTEAAKEIELSTKQQSTAVEQVNVAVANVAQATREAEASSGQALHTASQLATMSRDLARLVQPAAAA